MGSGASIDGEHAKDADDVDGKDREKLIECTSQPYKVIKGTNKFFANRDKGGYMDLNINLLFDKFNGCK